MADNVITNVAADAENTAWLLNLDFKEAICIV
jgi:hypothetical protein